MKPAKRTTAPKSFDAAFAVIDAGIKRIVETLAADNAAKPPRRPRARSAPRKAA